MAKPFIPKSVWGRAMAILCALIIALALFLAGKSLLSRLVLDGSWRSIVASHPALAVERVSFSRYLVQGTLPDNDPHFAKLDIWLVKGYADIQFDLSAFSINERKTDYLNRVLVLEYSGKDEFRPDVDIRIDPAGVRQIESVKPRAYTESELKAMAKETALVSGAVGALAGGVAGAAAGNAAGKSAAGPLAGILPVASYSGGIGAVLGAAAGGALAGGAAWCFTDKFIAALQSRANGKVSVMDMISAASPMMKAELAASERRNGEWRASFEARLASIARRAGWKSVIVEYGGRQ